MLLAGPVSHTSTQYMDLVDIFDVSPDLTTIYLAYFSWGLSFFCAWLSLYIPECCNLFSGVKKNI